MQQNPMARFKPASATTTKVRLHTRLDFLVVCASSQPASGQFTAAPQSVTRPCSIRNPLAEEAVPSSFHLLPKVFPLRTFMFTLLYEFSLPRSFLLLACRLEALC